MLHQRPSARPARATRDRRARRWWEGASLKVLIIGAGEVGYHVIGALYRENVEIVAIDSDPAVLEHLKTEFNITTLHGNATDSTLLAKAGAATADLFLGITNYDEANTT